MSNNINRVEIAKGVFFTAICDKRFKMNKITVNFMAQLDEKTVALNAVVPGILSKSSKAYPTFKELNNKLSALYAARLSDTVGKLGDTQYMGLSVTSVDDAYALDGEKITEEALDILLDCLFNPVVEKGVFPEKTTALEKQMLIDDIQAELNDKRSYAVHKGAEMAFRGEPAALSQDGTVELAEKINARDAYAAYENMLAHCPVEIICVGCNDFESAKEKLAKAFGEVERGEIAACRSHISKAKETAEEQIDKLSVTQSKMVLVMKSDLDNPSAIRIMSKVYGGTTTSKLFLNVREKLSLCYYCWARYNEKKGAMLIDCGIENSNIEKAKAEIIAQFEDMKKGNFTDDDVMFAKLNAQNTMKTIGDSLSAIAGWYLSAIYMNDIKTPEEVMEQDMAVTREQIIQAANSMKLDTVYILTSNGEGEANE